MSTPSGCGTRRDASRHPASSTGPVGNRGGPVPAVDDADGYGPQTSAPEPRTGLEPEPMGLESVSTSAEPSSPAAGRRRTLGAVQDIAYSPCVHLSPLLKVLVAATVAVPVAVAIN